MGLFGSRVDDAGRGWDEYPFAIDTVQTCQLEKLRIYLVHECGHTVIDQGVADQARVGWVSLWDWFFRCVTCILI